MYLVAAGVRRVSVLSSFYRGGVEAALDASPLPWTPLLPVEFRADTREWADQIRENRGLRWFRTAPSTMVHEADIAAVAVLASTEDDHSGEEYPITGPEALTPRERARLMDAGRYVEFGMVPATDRPRSACTPRRRSSS